MTKVTKPYFSIGEVAILQPPHPSARHLSGQETTILQIFWNDSAEDAMGGKRSGWSYYTDVQAPPPTDLPEDQHTNWVWCEYDLRKKYDPGEDFESLVDELKVSA
jgi:hypothetical protein